METPRQLIKKIESYNFECEAGSLVMCVDWSALKEQFRAAKAGGENEKARSRSLVNAAIVANDERDAAVAKTELAQLDLEAARAAITTLHADLDAAVTGAVAMKEECVKAIQAIVPNWCWPGQKEAFEHAIEVVKMVGQLDPITAGRALLAQKEQNYKERLTTIIGKLGDIKACFIGIDQQAESLLGPISTDWKADDEEIIVGYKLNTGLWHRLHGLLADVNETISGGRNLLDEETKCHIG